MEQKQSVTKYWFWSITLCALFLIIMLPSADDFLKNLGLGAIPLVIGLCATLIYAYTRVVNLRQANQKNEKSHKN